MNIKEWMKKHFEHKEDIADIAKYGCSGGVIGLIYYNETTKFYDDHVIEIWEMLQDAADQEGVKLMEKVHSLTHDEESYRTFRNKLVWWAVEVRAQELQVENAGTVTRTATSPVEVYTTQIHTRLRGRQMALKIESSATGVQWQLGVPRVDMRPDGRR